MESINPVIMWAIVLFAISLVLFVIEVFVPSGGMIGLVAAMAAIGAIILLFSFDTVAGLIASILSLVALPLLFVVAIKLWPNTPIARILTLNTQQQRLTDPDDQGASPANDELVGAEGQTLTDLRPVGTCRIKGQRIECLAARGMIPTNKPVRVIAVDGMNVKVEEV